MAKEYYPFVEYGGYGWAGMGPIDLARTITKSGIAIRKLQDTLKFDAVAFCGSSGSAIAFHLGIKYKIPLLYVRKKNEDCHGGSVECNGFDLQIKKYLIVDDFIDTGNTIHHIIDSIALRARKQSAYPAKPVGIFCFEQRRREKSFAVTDKKSIQIYSIRH
jgi:orotate phosphoribosyltransferase